jgi:DNA-binding NarL/FixJ family response regulator
MIEVVIMAPARNRRQWLERELSADSTIHVNGVASTFPFLRSLLAETPANVIVIDGATAEPSAVHDWFNELTEFASLIFLAASADESILDSFRRAQRGAVLHADATAGRLIPAIHAAAAGLLVFDASLMPQAETETPMEALTPREVDVLRLLAEGLGNRDIAHRLNISEHTVKFHIGSILGKFQASSRTEAVTRGLRSGLIEL